METININIEFVFGGDAVMATTSIDRLIALVNAFIALSSWHSCQRISSSSS